MHGTQALFEEDITEYLNAHVLEPSYRDARTGEELSHEESKAAEKIFNLKNQDATYKDSVTGQPLEHALVKAARKLEM